MPERSTGWMTAKTWIGQRIRVYILAIIIVTVVMAILMYFTWGAEPNRQYWLCISYIPITLFSIMVVIFLVVKAIFGAALLRTDRPLREVIDVVGSVLTRHGVTWTEGPWSKHTPREGDERSLRDIRGQTAGPEAYVISFDGGVVLLKQDTKKVTHMTFNPEDSLSPPLMKDIEEALA